MPAYQNLKAKLIHQFRADSALTHSIAAATTLDEILAALGESYRKWLLLASDVARGAETSTPVLLETAENAADAREAALLEILRFFERDYAATGALEVRRTGTRQLRIIRHEKAEAEP